MSTRIAHGRMGEGVGVSAHERFKARSRRWIWPGLVVSGVVHVGVLLYGPEFQVDPVPQVSRSGPIHALELVRAEIAIPAPPAPIRAPAVPVVAPVEVPSTLTMDAVPTFEPVTTLPDIPPPPPIPESAESELAGYQHILPSMVAPELVNRREIQTLLERSFPSALAGSVREVVVVMWFWIDEKGEIQKYEIKESSGYAVFDRAAEAVVERMRFRPAVRNGEPTRVIVSLPITFRVR